MQKNTNDLSNKKVTSRNSIDKSKKVLNKSTAAASKKSTTTEKKSASKKPEQDKTTVKATKTAATKKTVEKAATKISTAKKTTAKIAEKTAAAKKATTKATKKASTTKKTTSKIGKKTAVKKTSATKTKKATNSTNKATVLEYYDLPYRYNQTIVKILAQTPTTLFVYWDISDADRKKYIDEFGENFFDTTVPVLIVHNKTMNYSFEIEVNDFANSWYFNVNDAKCEYEIELGRRAKQNQINLPNNYMCVTSSNVIESPNNHILFEKNQKVLFFRNVKTNTTVSKDVSTFEFMKYAGKIYNIYNVYKEIYKHEELENLEKLSSSSF